MTMDVLRWIARGACNPEIILLEVHLESHRNKAIQINVVDPRLQAQDIMDPLDRMVMAIPDLMIEAHTPNLHLYRRREMTLVHLQEA